jgi:uncharacterized protein (UPF0276 family)
LSDARANAVGVGLRPPHYPRLLERARTTVEWFEAISENYMDSAGRPLAVLEHVRRDHPVALHGVSLSIGTRPRPVEMAAFREQRARYLKRLARLVERIEPFLVSDHLCWTGIPGSNLHDLLPIPRTDAALEWIVEQVDEVQGALGRRLVLENVSTYFEWSESGWSEQDFLVEVARRAGCLVLLDVNNVYVNARNHGFDARAFLDAIPADLVAEVHLAGHSDLGTHLFDTHSTPVSDEVWDLFSHVLCRLPAVPILVEWDADIPPFERLEAEAAKARAIAATASGRIQATSRGGEGAAA